MMFLLGLFLLAVGLLMLIRPSLWWELTERWKTDAGEPSGLFLKSARFGGICFAVVGAAGIVAFFVL